MAIEITEMSDPPGLKLFDSNEQRQLSIRTDRPASPDTSVSDRFCFPVDSTCRIDAETLIFDQKYLVNIHDVSGRADVRLEAGDTYELDSSTQFVGMDGPMKLYCRIADEGTITMGMNSIKITFDRPVSIEFGARSLHERPAGTITTPDDPRSVMDAITALGSALKTDTAERSWPTLRGHPPLIELGEEFSVDTTNTPPETGVTIETPPTYEDLFTIAPLSFYLGADLVPGPEPAVHTDSERYELGREVPLEDDVGETLKQLFFLDCLVRTEGVYQYDLHERETLESTLPRSPSTLYGMPLPKQLEYYLEVDYETVRPHLPRWPLTAYVPPRSSSAELLPFVVNELGIVRQPEGTTETIRTDVDTAAPARASAAGPLVRSASQHRNPSPSEGAESLSVVEPAVTDSSIEHAWFGDSIPRGASKATVEGYRNQLDRGSRTQSIEILLVCNDSRMLDEHDVLDETYGSREILPFEVDSAFGVASDDLAELLETGGYDFLHYIGHATADGLRCPDGELDVRSLSSVDLGVFFLNACQSYEQGLALARNGAFGGVATLGDVINEHAVESGAALARLLNLGFPLRVALEVVADQTVLGDQYLIVGDGSVDIAQTDGGAPTLVEVDRATGDEHEVRFNLYPAKEFRIGSVTSPNIESVRKLFLLPIQDIRAAVASDELRNYFSWTEMPVIYDGALQWNTDIGPPAFFDEICPSNGTGSDGD
ncbi:hypothetical protein [Halovivax limisalsi]|uniref:hypothetical protein n=1 Tax=Halovivax limisalsi TaxID=1453760 RepID=UPI001FFD9370|nr:hypothetical protein [Halovivax limisalsi]